MEIRVLSPTQAQPLPPVEWNYTEVKQYVEDGLSRYKGVVYDDTQIALAKTDRATLNKLAAAIDAKRKEMKAQYLQPYAKFEAQAKELTEMIKVQVNEIDAQVKAFDNFRKEEKLEKIKNECYAPMIGDLAKLVPYEKLHDPKWLNVSCSASTIGTEMARKIEGIVSGLDAIDKMGIAPDVVERVKSVFLRNFDLAAAIAEKDRIEKERAALAEYEAKQRATQAEQKYTPPEPAEPARAKEGIGYTAEKVHTEEPIQLDFRVWVTKDQMAALREFLQTNHIKYGRVPTV